MNRNIELGQSKDAETNRDLHQWWEEFRQQKKLFESLFEEKICTAPEELQAIHDEMHSLYDKVLNECMVFLFVPIHPLYFTKDANSLGFETRATDRDQEDYLPCQLH